MQRQITFARDPLMLAIPKGIDIGSDDRHILVGAAWGPDFDDIVATAVSISKVSGQRETLTSLMAEWGKFSSANSKLVLLTHDGYLNDYGHNFQRRP